MELQGEGEVGVGLRENVLATIGKKISAKNLGCNEIQIFKNALETRKNVKCPGI